MFGLFIIFLNLSGTRREGSVIHILSPGIPILVKSSIIALAVSASGSIWLFSVEHQVVLLKLNLINTFSPVW